MKGGFDSLSVRTAADAAWLVEDRLPNGACIEWPLTLMSSARMVTETGPPPADVLT
jgi:hypothetical protein